MHKQYIHNIILNVIEQIAIIIFIRVSNFIVVSYRYTIIILYSKKNPFSSLKLAKLTFSFVHHWNIFNLKNNIL